MKTQTWRVAKDPDGQVWLQPDEEPPVSSCLTLIEGLPLEEAGQFARDYIKQNPRN